LPLKPDPLGCKSNVFETLRVIAFATLLASLSCATVKVPQPIGGSRAVGTVQLAYEYGGFERPQVDWETGNQIATERCRGWGYSEAESFGGGVSQCTAYNQYGCLQFFVTITYQCLGGSGY
jgi:hypothetical protein